MRSFISLFIALALVACSEAPVPMEGADENGFSAPTAATLAANKAVAERIAAYPSEDFEQARRGLIASADSLVIRDPDGKEVWNQDAYGFIEGDAPKRLARKLVEKSHEKYCTVSNMFKSTVDISSNVFVNGETC